MWKAKKLVLGSDSCALYLLGHSSFRPALDCLQGLNAHLQLKCICFAVKDHILVQSYPKDLRRALR